MMTHGNFYNGCVGRLFLLIITSLCWAGSCLFAQPAQLDFRHYTIDDGLPSSEVYTTFEDRDGFLWIGTDNGVARFDGYEFTVFDRDDGLEDMVVFTFHEDAQGRLWVSTYSGRIFYFEDGRFHPYIHNDITTEFKINSHIVKLLDVTEDGSMIVHIKGSKIAKITLAGEVIPLTGDSTENGTYNVYFPKRSERIKNNGGANSLYFARTNAPKDGNIQLQVLKENSDRTSSTIQFNPVGDKFIVWYAGVLDRSGHPELVIASNSELIITAIDVEKTFRYPMQYGRMINYVLPGKQGNEYWLFLNRGLGVEHHKYSSESKDYRVANFLSGHSVSSGLIDKNGGFWITTLDDGIYYCPFPEQKIYRKDNVTENAKSISLALTGRESFYAGYDDGSIFRYDEGEEALWDIQEPEITTDERMFDMFYDSSNSRMYTSFYQFKHPLKAGEKLDQSKIVKYQFASELFYKAFDNFSYLNYLPDLYPDKLFATRSRAFVEVSLNEGKSGFHSMLLGVDLTGGHVLAADSKGRRFLGTLHGLYEISPTGEMIPENLGVEELSGRVVFIKSVNKDGLLFGTRGNGLVYYNQDTSYLIRESDGLASDMVRDIHKDGKGVFWISTLNGLSKVSFSADGRKYELRTFRTENGLPSNEVSQTDSWGDQVWLATSAGIMRFIETPIDSMSPSPTIRKVLVNGLEMGIHPRYDLPARRQGVSIHFGTINYALGSRVNYRYRIAADAPWQYTRDRTANYPDLSAGSYYFAVQSRNQDAFWSESTVLEIEVASPWYESFWAFTGGIGLLLLGLSTYFLIRERRRKREQDLLFQINELEHAALHAQMNPHFVFNALNSIQNFVLENNAKQAATYLSRFARIIRQTLRSSVDGKHTLKEELDMLRTYLVLEKLRFKDGFNYELTVGPDLSLEEIDLPPLLIQPFIENAIVHGLKDRKRGGWISIDFSGSSAALRVRIEDNGIGYDPVTDVKNDSLGMDITRKRLDMMNRGLKDHSGMIIEPLRNDDGTVGGTRVTLSIQLEKPPETSSLVS